MKNLNVLLIFSGLLMCYNANAQLSLEREVIASAGGNESTVGNHSLTWTAGEMMVATETSGTIVLAQGFQQPNRENESSVTVNQPNVELTVYPNPTSDVVHIKVDAQKAQELNFVLYSAIGKRIALPETTISTAFENEKKINLEHLSTGTYFLEFRDAMGQKFTTIKIVKK